MMTGSHLYRYGIHKINWWSVLRLHWQKRSVLEINTILSAINKILVKHCIQSQSYKTLTHLLFSITQFHNHTETKRSGQFCDFKIAKEENKTAGHQRVNTELTTCMAELLGGCGSMSSWEGVCPKLRIWASTAWKRHRQVCMLRGANYRQ